MRDVYELAQRQGGIVLRSQVLEMGVTSRTLTRRVQAGYWVAMPRGVLRLPGAAPTRELYARALCLARPETVLTGPAAGDFLGDGPWRLVADNRVWVTTSQGRPDYRGVVRLEHPGCSTAWRGSIQVAIGTCLIADLIRKTPAHIGRGVALASIQQRHTTVARLLSEAAKLTGTAGEGKILRAVDHLLTGAHVESELRLHELLLAAEIKDWIANYPLTLPNGRVAYLDVAFPAERLGIEVDGRAHHTAEADFESDRIRQNAIHALEWRLLRFTWATITEQPQYVVETVRNALRRSNR